MASRCPRCSAGRTRFPGSTRISTTRGPKPLRGHHARAAAEAGVSASATPSAVGSANSVCSQADLGEPCPPCVYYLCRVYPTRCDSRSRARRSQTQESSRPTQPDTSTTSHTAHLTLCRYNTLWRIRRVRWSRPSAAPETRLPPHPHHPPDWLGQLDRLVQVLDRRSDGSEAVWVSGRSGESDRAGSGGCWEGGSPRRQGARESRWVRLTPSPQDRVAGLILQG